MSTTRGFDADTASRWADPFDAIVAALHEAALDEGRWPRALALVDAACGMHGSYLAVVAENGSASPRLLEGRFYSHGARCHALEQDYLGYFDTDERIPRLMLLPAGTMLANADLYATEERRASRTFNEHLPRWDAVNQLNVRLPALDGRHTLWMPTRGRRQGGWRPSQLRLLRRLLPHIGQTVRVRQALASGRAPIGNRASDATLGPTRPVAP